MKPVRCRSRISIDFYAIFLILAVGPAVMALLPAIPFANNVHCDPWYIFGAYYNYPDFLRWFPAARQVARVPEIIPGYFFTRVLNGVLADYALFLFYYVVSLFFLHQTARLIMSRVPSLLATISFATQPLILGNYSATLDAPAVTYNIICLYLVIAAARSEEATRRRMLICGSGLALGAAVHAYLGMITFAFANYVAYAAYALLYRRDSFNRRIGEIASGALLTLFGVIVATVVTGLVLMAFGGSFTQVMNQIWAIPQVSKNAAAFFWKDQWYLEGSVVGLLLLAGGVSVLNLMNAQFASRHEHRESGLILALSIATLSLIIVQLLYNSIGGVFIQYDYYYFFMIPYITLIIFSPFTYVRLPLLFGRPVGAMLFLLGSLATILPRFSDLPKLYSTPTRALVSMGLAICAVCLYAAPSIFPRHARSSTLGYLSVLLLFSVVVRPTQVGQNIWTEQANPLRAQEAYARIRQGLEFLHTVNFARPPKFWVDMEYNPGELLAYPRSYFYCGFPQFPDALPPAGIGLEPFRADDDVVVVSRLADLSNTAKAAFANDGIKVTEIATAPIVGDNVGYGIVVEHVTATEEVPAARRWTAEPPAGAEIVPEAFGLPAGKGVVSSPDQELPIEIVTPSQPWGYAAMLTSKKPDLRGPLWIEIEIKVLEGEIGIGVEDISGKDFLARKLVRASTDTATIVLPIRAPTLLGRLVIQSWDQGKVSRAEIERIAVLRAAPAH